ERRARLSDPPVGRQPRSAARLCGALHCRADRPDPVVAGRSAGTSDREPLEIRRGTIAIRNRLEPREELMFKGKHALAAAALGAAALALASMGPASAADQMTLTLNWLAQPFQSGFFLAKEKGYYEDEGI